MNGKSVTMNYMIKLVYLFSRTSDPSRGYPYDDVSLDHGDGIFNCVCPKQGTESCAKEGYNCNVAAVKYGLYNIQKCEIGDVCWSLAGQKSTPEHFQGKMVIVRLSV